MVKRHKQFNERHKQFKERHKPSNEQHKQFNERHKQFNDGSCGDSTELSRRASGKVIAIMCYLTRRALVIMGHCDDYIMTVILIPLFVHLVSPARGHSRSDK